MHASINRRRIKIITDCRVRAVTVYSLCNHDARMNLYQRFVSDQFGRPFSCVLLTWLVIPSIIAQCTWSLVAGWSVLILLTASRCARLTALWLTGPSRVWRYREVYVTAVIWRSVQPSGSTCDHIVNVSCMCVSESQQLQRAHLMVKLIRLPKH